MTGGGRDWPAAAAHPPDGEEDALDVGEPERELELALAYLSELRRFDLPPYDAAVVARATHHAKRAHRLIFRARWAA